MVQSNTKKGQQIQWRRDKVQELSVKGFGQREIARMLDIPKSTIANDIDILRQEARETIKNHLQKQLPYEYSKCLLGLEDIIKQAYSIAENGNTKDKLSSLALIKDTYNTKMDLLTNASLLQDSIKFVEQNKISSKKDEKKFHQNENLGNDIQGSTEDNSDTTEQFNQVF